MKDFLSRFRITMNRITEAGGKVDDFVVTDMFEREFKKIPELKDNVSRMESSSPDSKRHTFQWQWETAENVCHNLEAAKTQAQLLKGCDPNAADVNTAAVGDNGKGGSKGAQSEAQWKEKREKYKNVACPRAIMGNTCTHHTEGKCYYSHDKNLVAKVKSKPLPKGKLNLKRKGKMDQKAKEIKARKVEAKETRIRSE